MGRVHFVDGGLGEAGVDAFGLGEVFVRLGFGDGEEGRGGGGTDDSMRIFFCGGGEGDFGG